MAPATLLRSLRLIHLYFGVFIAPAVLFFAFTGALQTFSLHESTRGSNYIPPQWAVTLGQIHKKQTSITPTRKPAPAEAKPSSPPQRDVPALQPSRTVPLAAPQPTSPSPSRHPLPLKIFFLLVSIGLVTSTFTGIYMAYKYKHRPSVISLLLLAGATIPIALLFV